MNDDDQNKKDQEDTKATEEPKQPEPEATPVEETNTQEEAKAAEEPKAEEPTATAEEKTQETVAAETAEPAETPATETETVEPAEDSAQTPEEPEAAPAQNSEEPKAEEEPEATETETETETEATPETAETEQADGQTTEETPEEASAETPTSFPTNLKDVKGARWYVVHTYSGHEAKVAATLKQRVESQKLQDKVLDILVPTQDKIEIKEGKKNKIKEKIFPGYLLIRMVLDDNTWLVVRTTPGITSFVGMGNRPTPLPDSEVASIQRFMSMEAPKFKASFSVGEAVKITDGPFSEFLGSISEIDDEKGKIKVLVSIFGRETPVELDFLQVAKL